MDRTMTPFRRAASVAVLCVLGIAAPAHAARTETPLASPPGPFGDVVRSLVTIDAPLPAGVPAHPAACDRLRYYRYRRAGGPADPQRADAVFVAMPGLLGGAGSLEMHGLGVVQQAADRGSSVEVWALDRRSNCLEDRHGLDAAARADDPNLLIDYYFGRREVDGRRFGGFLRNGRLGLLAHFDLRQTLEDYRAVILDGMPDPQARARSLFCGGHSLGGSLTGQLMAWDFDGNPATTTDAGFRLCRGSIALDSVVAADRSGTGRTSLGDQVTRLTRGLTYDAATALINRNLRVLDVGAVGPETVGALTGVGLLAALRPEQDSAPFIARIPRGGAADQGLRLFHSRTAADLLAPVAMLRRQHLTGEALLGALLDDDTQPFGFIRTSVGRYDGGPVALKRFGGGGPLLFPTSTSRLYGWANFDEEARAVPRIVGAPGGEVSDIGDVARILHEGPMDFAEQYFPTRITSDVAFAQSGARSGDLRRVRYTGGPVARPRLTVLAENGVSDGAALAARRGDRLQVLPGYDHLDVVFASPRAPGGGPEPSARAVVDFMLDHAGTAPPAG